MAGEGGPERLYTLPLDDFVRERDELARRLRKDGKRAEAEEVRRLRKPTVVAWAVNQLVHGRRDEVGRFLAAADRLRDAQTGRGGDFAAAAAAERDAVRELARAAGDVLREAGRPATEATLDRVARTLHAAAADDDARRTLERGTLSEEVEPTGFGGLLGALAPAAGDRRERKPAEEDDERARRRAAAREELAQARARLRELEEEATAAEREAAQRRRAAEPAEREAAEARSRAEAARAELEVAERRLRDL